MEYLPSVFKLVSQEPTLGQTAQDNIIAKKRKPCNTNYINSTGQGGKNVKTGQFKKQAIELRNLWISCSILIEFHYTHPT